MYQKAGCFPKVLAEMIRPLGRRTAIIGCVHLLSRKGPGPWIFLVSVWTPPSSDDWLHEITRTTRAPGSEVSASIARAPRVYPSIKFNVKYADCPWFFCRRGKRLRDFRGAWEIACKAAKLVYAEGNPSRIFHDHWRTGVRNLIRGKSRKE